MNLPKISVVVPTFNEEKRIELCLQSIFDQDYPKDKFEVFVADDSSTDKTLEIARQFPVKIITHNSKDPEVAKKLALEKSTGGLFVYFDADIHLRGENWFKKMARPLTENSNIAASFTRYYSDEHSSSIEKYLNLDPLQRDPVYQYFSPKLESLVVEERDRYQVLRYEKNKIPPAGLCLHRASLIKPLAKNERLLELDLLVSLVEEGHDRFAYVPDAGLFHHHALSFWDLVKKRSRNVTWVYLKDNEIRKYRWFNLKSPIGFLKVLFWVVWANLIVPSVATGLFKLIKHGTFIALYEPLVSLFVTDMIIIAFLGDARGRKLTPFAKGKTL